MQNTFFRASSLAVGAAVLLLAARNTAQITPQIPVLDAPPSVLAGFQTTAATMQDLSLPRTGVASLEVEVVLGGKTYTIVLREHDVRAKDYKLIVDDGKSLRVVPTPANSTYRGVVRGFGDSVIAASLWDGQLTAMIQLDPDTPSWNIQPLSTVIAGANRATHVMHFAGHSNVPEHQCGTTGVPTQPVPSAPTSTSGTIYECEIACDADFEKYTRHGSNVTTTQNDVASVINACSVIYKRDVEVEYLITQTIVRTSRTYTTNDYSLLLNQYRNYWVNNHGSVVRDVSHLFTGKNRTTGVIGVAWLSSICSKSIGYGLSFTHFTSNFTSRVGLTAHELGHSFGANHCSGGACYIMCAGLGGCGGNLTRFGTASINAIVAFRNSRPCLSRKAGDEPIINTVTPGTVNAFRGGTVALDGSKFTGALKVKVGAAVLTPGTDPRLNFKLLSDTKIEFEAPTAASLFPIQVTVETPKGVSLPKALQFKETDPVLLVAAPDAVRGQPYFWEFGGGVADQYFLIASPTSTTFQFLGETWLSQQIIMKAGVLTFGGYGDLIIPAVPQSAAVGLQFWTQVITINTFPQMLDGNSNVVSTTVK